jgi:hypothetical protein
MGKMCTLITSKGTDIDENIANQNHATRTRTPKPGYLNLSNTLLLVDWANKKQYTRDDEPTIFCINQDKNIDNEVHFVCIEFSYSIDYV